MQITFLVKDDPMSWCFMPQALDRIKRFCVDNGLDHDPDELAKMITYHFVSDNPTLSVVVAHVDSKVVAHCLIGIDEFMGNKYLTIIQLQVDDDVIVKNLSMFKAAFSDILQWGYRRGASEVQLLTPDERRANYFSRVFGFRKHRVLMRRSIIQEK